MNTKLFGYVAAIPLFINSSMLSAAPIEYSDETFSDGDWTHTVILDETPGGGSFSASQSTPGGNPGNYQRGNHAYGPGLIVYGHIFGGGGTYDPSMHGAIEHIDFSHDFIVLTLQYSDSTDVATSLLLEQAGRFYVGIGDLSTFYELNVFAYGFPWTSASNNLLNAEFVEVTASGLIAGTPDFSNSGTPIGIGYASWNSTGYTGNSHDWGMDNLRVTVNPFSDHFAAPIPATVLLAITGLAALGYTRSRIAHTG